MFVLQSDAGILCRLVGGRVHDSHHGAGRAHQVSAADTVGERHGQEVQRHHRLRQEAVQRGRHTQRVQGHDGHLDARRARQRRLLRLLRLAQEESR